MYPFRTVSIIPRLPESIRRLKELAYNLWFSWNDSAMELFRSINTDLWEEVYHNPVKFLLRVNENELKKAAQNKEFINRYEKVMNSFDRYMHSATWYEEQRTAKNKHLIAYFSAEFGVHESHPTYSGGLGLLAGDHCKAASDLGLPFVGMGLLYKNGYFTQRINSAGRQEAYYPYMNFFEMPVTPVLNEQGREVIVSVKLPGRRVHAKVWRMLVGRVSIFFLDADLNVNSQEDRELTSQLYGGDRDTRIGQEILLGRLGIRALQAMGIHPTVWHINEGHAAFLLIERIRELVEDKGLPLGSALEMVRADTVFTTHTPVPAGHDVFSIEMVDRYFNHLYERMGITREQFFELAHDGKREGFNMTMLALGRSGFSNGVSRLHGEVSRAMFHNLYQGVPEEEVPIGHVTNGVHTLTWLAPEMRNLLDSYLKDGWDRNTSNIKFWEQVNDIPNEDLWEVHMTLKDKALLFARNRLVKQRVRNQETMDRINEVENYLRPEVLTIGFARRFATYKRADLLFWNKEKLADLVNDSQYPIQFIFAGKAHPADDAGQDMIKMINDIAEDELFRGKIIFLENYDINVSRYLLQGVDVWLNTPRRPLEASGTSGMKTAVNGVLNCSVLDGWWPEIYNTQNGFALGAEWSFPDQESQDRYDFNSLYSILKQVIIPTYYNQEGNVPQKWVSWMKESIKTIAPLFSTERMVQEYTEKYYMRAMERNYLFKAKGHRVSRELYELKQFLKNNWHYVKIVNVETNGSKTMHLGDKLTVRATIQMGSISRQNIKVEIVYGEEYENGLRRINTVPLELDDNNISDSGVYIYTGSVILPQGTFGYTVRARPFSPYLAHYFELPLVCWVSPF